jgi:phage host-nuclease inhibitor protein Gam
MATTQKTKKKVVTNVTVEAAQDAAKDYTNIANKLSATEAKMNNEINKVKEKYLDSITTLQENIKEPEAILEAFAYEQKESWGKRKSIELLHAVIGFRTGQPKVTKDKKFTWDAVLELMKKSNLFSGFVRSKEEINKEAILAEKNVAVLNQLKEDCYISIDQDESFFITPKVEEINKN